MKPREYCCCAIPMVNVGIYTTLVEQFVAGILIGALSVATPSIVGAATPAFASWLLGILCFVAAGVQVLGFIGVARERPILYRRYVTLHGLVLTATFAVALAWIITSATRHSTASSTCVRRFFSDDSQQSQGQTLCDIFAWADVGIMGGLWVILAILHAYLFLVLSSYGSSQRRDHQQYDTLNDPLNPLTKDSIPMADRSDPWNTRTSTDSGHTPDRPGARYQHLRQLSTASTSDVLNQPYQQPNDSLSRDYGYKSSYYTPPMEKPLDSGHSTTQPALGAPHPNDGYYTGSSNRL